MSLAKKILLGIAAVIVVLVLVIATRPSELHVERSITVNTPAALPFEKVDDFHHWTEWSPYDKLDPLMQRTYEGPTSGVGAKYGWSGNDKVGEGRMTIEKSVKPSNIVISLQFIKPMAVTNKATFTFVPEGAGTKVIWAMDGHCNFVSKAFGLVMDMDKMIGEDFAKGLAQLKSVSEEAAKNKATEAAKSAP